MISARPVRLTMTAVIEDMPIAGRLVSAAFTLDVEHVPAQLLGVDACYCDSPPDPSENTITAIAVNEWCEYDDSGDEVPRVLDDVTIIEHARPILQSRIDDDI